MGLTRFTYQIQLKTKQILFSHYKMENLLKQIVNNTETKRSFSIVVSDNKIRFKTWYKPPIQLDKKKDYEILLINLEKYYSFVLVIHLVLTHHGLIIFFQKVVITLKILMSLFNEE